MFTSFGVKEAERAGEFAKTKEQKETVLAVVRMMDIPILIIDQVKKQVNRLTKSIDKKHNKTIVLRDKIRDIEHVRTREVNERHDLNETEGVWTSLL